MKYKGNKISFSILFFLFFFSCSPSINVDSEIIKKVHLESNKIDTLISINDLFFIEGEWIDSNTHKVSNKAYFDSWKIMGDSIVGKSTQLQKNSQGVFDTIYNESMSMIGVENRVMYVIRSSKNPLLAYPLLKKAGDSLIFKNMAQSVQDVIFINESKDHFQLLLRGKKGDYKREIIYNYYRVK